MLTSSSDLSFANQPTMIAIACIDSKSEFVRSQSEAMIEQTPPSPEDLTAQQTAQMLRRILDAIERKHRKRWVEIVCAIVLALATTASAWCAYESKRWSSTQTFRMAAANKAGRLASENTIAALQFRAFDASMFIAYVEAQSAGNKQMEAFLYQRFRTEMKKAVDAWLATNPSTNPLAPKSPFHMPEYQQPEALDASGQQDEANRMINQAQQAGCPSPGQICTSDSLIRIRAVLRRDRRHVRIAKASRHDDPDRPDLLPHHHRLFLAAIAGVPPIANAREASKKPFGRCRGSPLARERCCDAVQVNGRTLLPQLHVQQLHTQAERHRDIDVSLGQMLVRALSHQHHADEDEE